MRNKYQGVPRFAVGVAAGGALFLTITMWWSPAPELPATSFTQTASIQPVEPENSEFVNNIDFYTWLEKQSDTVADAGGT